MAESACRQAGGTPRAWAVAAAGMAGAMLATAALLLDRVLAAPPCWEGPMEFAAERREYVPRCTVPLEAGRTAAIEVHGKAPASARLRLHVRSDDSACLGEVELSVGPGAVRRTVLLRPAVDGPHTLIWEAEEGPSASLALRILPRSRLPVAPVAAAGCVFAAAAALGLARVRDGVPGRSRAVSRGAALGILLALAALFAARAAQDPLALRADGPVEPP